MLDDPQVLALCASFLFGLALVLTQFGLRHVPPSRGASVSIPTSAARPMLPLRTAATKQRKAAVSTSRIIRRSYEMPAKITSSLVWPDRIALLR